MDIIILLLIIIIAVWVITSIFIPILFYLWPLFLIWFIYRLVKRRNHIDDTDNQYYEEYHNTTSEDEPIDVSYTVKEEKEDE